MVSTQSQLGLNTTSIHDLQGQKLDIPIRINYSIITLLKKLLCLTLDSCDNYYEMYNAQAGFKVVAHSFRVGPRRMLKSSKLNVKMY